MNILAFDTASSLLNIALSTDRGFFEINHSIGLTHSEHLLPSVDYLLRTAGSSAGELDLIICTRGPGSFTGLRIGMATAKGMAAAGGFPLVSIPTLAVYAADCVRTDALVIPVIDARKRRYYSAIYRNSNAEHEELDLSAQQLLSTHACDQQVIITGPDARRFYQEILHDHPAMLSDLQTELSLDPNHDRGHGHRLIEMGTQAYARDGADSDDQGPVYLRKSEAEISLDQRSGR
jgi:tRNA threonylcarbamoyladenosine biosynthesis protein TsaB